jgi:hypothetical protein
MKFKYPERIRKLNLKGIENRLLLARALALAGC